MNAQCLSFNLRVSLFVARIGLSLEGGTPGKQVVPCPESEPKLDESQTQADTAG
jgi:hypothetical protein